MSDEIASDSGEVADVSDVATVDSEPSSAPEQTSSPAAAPQQAASDPVYYAFRSLPQFQGMDDRSIATHLYQAMQREEAATRALQQYQTIIPAATEYMNNRDAFQKWQSSQQQAAQPPVPEEKPWWSPPALRDAYKQYLVKDESGREVISQEAPLDARHALVEYQQYKADFAKKFLENPEQALGPMVERVAAERANDIVQQHLGQYQARQYVHSLEQENKDWLYDQNGNVSAEGRAAQEYIQQAKTLGIQSPQARWDFAVAMVERDLLNRHYATARQVQQTRPVPQPAAPQPPVQPSVAEKNMEFLRQQASRKPSQTTPETTDPRVPRPAKTFAQKLAQQAQDKGLLDPT
jgi:hypothetical protein